MGEGVSFSTVERMHGEARDKKAAWMGRTGGTGGGDRGQGRMGGQVRGTGADR